MTGIGPIGSQPILHTRNYTAEPEGSRHGQAAQVSRRDADSVELSGRSRLQSIFDQLPEMRQDLVNDVRARIESGTYLSDDMVDVAIDRLADQLT